MSFIYPLCLLLLPMVIQYRGWHICYLFIAAAVTHGLFALNEWMLYWDPIILSSSTTALHDTYYVVHPVSPYLSQMVICLVAGLVIALQNKIGALFYPRATQLCFWIYNLGVAAAIAGQPVLLRLATPRRYIDYAESFALVNLIISGFTLLILIGGLGWITLTVWSLIQRYMVNRI